MVAESDLALHRELLRIRESLNSHHAEAEELSRTDGACRRALADAGHRLELFEELRNNLIDK